MKKLVVWNGEPWAMQYEEVADFITDMSSTIGSYNDGLDNIQYKCTDRGEKDPEDPGYFLPVFIDKMNMDGQKVNFKDGRCFKDITFTLKFDNLNGDTFDRVKLVADVEDAATWTCYDYFFFATRSNFHVEAYFFSGQHEIVFDGLDEDQKKDILYNGIDMYLFCDGFTDAFISAFKMVLCFAGGLGPDPNIPIFGSHVPEYMEKANIDFIQKAMGIKMEVRETQEVVIDEKDIRSGDFFVVMRLDGLDQIIEYGTGSRSGHSVMALWFEDGLHIVESQGAWYWPNKGIQRTAWKDWLQYAKNCDFHVLHLPLDDENANKFNETAAHEFFNQTAGLPYGYHNFLFSWLDTPEDNLPPILAPHILPIIFSVLESVDPTTVDIFFGQALNFRLGTKGLNVKQLTSEAARQNMTLEEVISIKEVDHWVYEGEQPRDGWSYVCSCYVAGMWKVAGLFGDLDIQATEQTPKDVYQYKFYDTKKERPEQCVKADPNLPYCQLLGKYRIELNGWSTVEPYDNMNENCPSISPDYVRPDGC